MNIKSHLKIAAIVVTYNRKELLKDCLEGLLSQTRPLDSIILVDNASTDGTPWFLEKHGYLANPIVDYCRLPENTGGAGGFHYGVKRGYEKGFDWLWLMDDDAEPRSDSLSILIENLILLKNDNIGALAQTVLDQNGDICYDCRGYINFKTFFPKLQTPIDTKCYNETEPVKIDFASFVGILISRKIIEMVGLPDKRFFICNDDVEYSLRIRQFANLFLIPHSLIVHKFAARSDIEVKHFLGRKRVMVPLNNYKMGYFYNRNLFYIVRKYNKDGIFFYLSILIYWIRLSAGIILWDDNKYTRLKIIWSSLFDGLLGRFNKNAFFLNLS